MKFPLALMASCLLVAACSGEASEEYGARQGKLQPTQLLRSYQGFVNDFTRDKDTYRMEYHVGDSHRFEQRSESGEVSGTYAFVAPEGDEYEFKYEADDEGFKVEGDALPEAPEETDEVKAARKAFFEAYEKQVELAGDYEYDSDEFDDDDEESSEESSEEDSDEESDEDDEDEEDEEGQVRGGSYFGRGASRIPQPSNTVPYPYRRRS